MRTALVLFTRDLRVHDHPALAAAARADHVVPAFVLDRSILSGPFAAPNRVRFLLQSLEDLDRSLRRRGAGLLVRRGDWVTEALRLARESGAETICCSDDVTGYARARLHALGLAARSVGIEVAPFPGVTVVPAGALATTGGGAYRVFTPYHRRWREAPRRPVAPLPRRLSLPPGTAPGPIPGPGDLGVSPGSPGSPGAPAGGESAARRRLRRWLDEGLAGYERGRDDLAADATSRLSPYLHLGCLSPLEVERSASGLPGAEPFLRQLCWRDFFAQALAERPEVAWSDGADQDWRDDEEGLEAWREGRTGYPVVDAAMRQLRHDGFVPNRARMVVASFLTKDLGIDWRVGARHFLDWLVDGDLASNNLNWQWTAGLLPGPNPHRVLDPTRQGHRFDPDGSYVRRFVGELGPVAGGAVHEPWRLDPARRRRLGYPSPIVDHGDAVDAYRARRFGHRAR